MKNSGVSRVKLIDSHTGGEPTRVVVSGCPDLRSGPLSERRTLLREQHDWLRTACLLEPRGFEAMVGAVLVEPHAEDCVAGVIFFNNVGYLNMCIHGTIGLAKTLQYMEVIGSEGRYRIDTPVGVVVVEMQRDGSVSVENVPSYRAQAGLKVDVPGYGEVVGDLAWGGNWFYLVEGYGPEVVFENIEDLTSFTKKVMAALEDQGITGADGGKIDHIEVFGPPANGQSDSRSFVLCPGGEYDRSPCGTGTSAKLACLYDKGVLEEGALWRQSSILNTIFTGRVKATGEGNRVIPTITGSAWVNGESILIIDSTDPFCYGISRASDL